MGHPVYVSLLRFPSREEEEREGEKAQKDTTNLSNICILMYSPKKKTTVICTKQDMNDQRIHPTLLENIPNSNPRTTANHCACAVTKGRKRERERAKSQTP
jgi:hypothetical protein